MPLYLGRSRPLATWALVLANAAVYGAMIASGVDPMNPSPGRLLDFGANFRPLAVAGEGWRLFTCTFVHVGALHILFNMYVLTRVGPFVESMLGRAPFLALYVAAGLAGSLASVAWNPRVVSAGASGAVFGLFGAILAIALRGGRGRMPPGAARSLFSYAAQFVALNVVFGMAVGGIDNAAHLGGLLGGFLAGLALVGASVFHGRGASPRTAVVVLAVAIGASAAGLYLLRHAA